MSDMFRSFALSQKTIHAYIFPFQRLSYIVINLYYLVNSAISTHKTKLIPVNQWALHEIIIHMLWTTLLTTLPIVDKKEKFNPNPPPPHPTIITVNRSVVALQGCLFHMIDSPLLLFYFQVIQERTLGTTDFNRTWAEYEAGFGELITDHWLGKF